VLDNLGPGLDTPFSRQILQEILDHRENHDRAGLLVTSRYSLDDLAAKLADDAIPSRLAGLCEVIQIGGRDGRLGRFESRQPAAGPADQIPSAYNE
jgi:DNA replication protein DnaC